MPLNQSKNFLTNDMEKESGKPSGYMRYEDLTNEQLYSKMLAQEKEKELNEPQITKNKKVPAKKAEPSPRISDVVAKEQGIWNHSGVTSSIEPLIQSIAQKKIDEWSSPNTKRSNQEVSALQPSAIASLKLNTTKQSDFGYDLSEMVRDRKQFIKQLNGQFGGMNVNELISMQLDEFKVKNEH